MTPEEVYAILKGQGKQRYLGSINNFTTPGSSEQADLNAKANGSPKNGDTVSVISDNSIWKYSEDSGEWTLYATNAPIDKASVARYGVVKIGDGIKVLDGTISTDKKLVGLEYVDNIRQYSEINPAPEVVVFDGVKYEGNTELGVNIESQAVKYVKQSLTAEEKKIARENIGVGSAEDQSDWNQKDTAKSDYIKNKPKIPEKISELINDDYTVKDQDYSNRVFDGLGQKNNTITQVEVNKNDIITLKKEESDLEKKVDDEIDRSTGTDNKLQNQINQLRGKTQIIGGTNCAVGAEQTVLTQYTRTKTGDSINRPRAGDTVNVIYDDNGHVRQEQWAYCVITDADGNVTNSYWEMVAGPPLVQTATETSLGVVQVPEDGGILIDIDGNITATKNSIGLGKLDNVRQYSEANPAPIKLILDGVEFNGTNKNMIVSTGAVLYDRNQVLTDAQKATARNNIGIESGVKPNWEAAENEAAGILNKPLIPTKTSQLENDAPFVIDANYVHTDYNYSKAAVDNLAENTANIKIIQNRLTNDETDLQQEKVTRANADADLQQQIDNLKGTPQFVGSIKSMTSTQDLTNFVKSETGAAPVKGNLVSVLDDGVIYMYDGSAWKIYMQSTMADATKTTKGVVQIGTGIDVSNGVISADKASIGLNYVDNVQQYSLTNPVPINITVDGTTTYGNSATGVDIVTDYVRYGTAQNLTDAQKQVARTNIGVDETLMSKSDWEALPGQAGEILNKPTIPKKTSQLINDNYTVIDANYEDRVFANKVEKETTFDRITANEDDIADIKDEQLEQNQEIANLKKKSYWVGSIQAFDEASDTDAKKATELTNYVKNKLGVDPAEGNDAPHIQQCVCA